MNELMVYLKTTETCQLNCEHCFTSGSQGKKIFFDPDKTIGFFKRLKEVVPVFKKGGNISFHGGEPMLAPIADMLKVYREISPLWPEIWWSVQTNLVYKLDDEKIAFFNEVTKKQTLGTSWDYQIRFPNQKAEDLWATNVKTLTDLGYPLTVMVSVTSKTIQIEPKEIIEKMIGLGVQYLNFERMTPNGNARSNESLAAGNKNLQDWFLKMWEQTVEGKYYEKIQNMFFNSILTPLVHSTHSGCRCRTCEQKIFTLNADGSVGGCPNSAVEKPYAMIDWPMLEIMYSKGRMKEIACEAVRNPGCYGCDVFDICNGDCHQLAWDGDICPAPKSLMQKLKYTKEAPYGDVSLMRDVLNGFIGQE